MDEKKRKNFISTYFTEIQLNSNYLDLYFVRTSIRNFIVNNNLHISGKVLDVGCGIMPYKEIIEGVVSVSQYIGVDFESSLADEYALGKPDFFWNGKVLPIESNTIDTIIATELLEHCEYPDQILTEMARVLKPGGKMLLTVPFIWNLHLVPFDEYRYTPFSLSRHIRNAKLDIIKLNPLGLWDASLAQMIGIWIQNRPLRHRNIYAFFGKFVIRLLLSKEKKLSNVNILKDGVMVTGLSALVQKNS